MFVCLDKINFLVQSGIINQLHHIYTVSSRSLRLRSVTNHTLSPISSHLIHGYNRRWSSSVSPAATSPFLHLHLSTDLRFSPIRCFQSLHPSLSQVSHNKQNPNLNPRFSSQFHFLIPDPLHFILFRQFQFILYDNEALDSDLCELHWKYCQIQIYIIDLF